MTHLDRSVARDDRPGAVVDGWIDGMAPGDVVLHARRADTEHGRSLRFRAPVETLRLEPGADPLPLLAALDVRLGAGYAVAGYLAYEAGYPLVRVAAPAHAPYPAAWFGVYDRVEELDHRGRAAPVRAARPGALRAGGLGLSREAHEAAVASVHAALAAGECYQLNLTTSLEVDVRDLAEAYRALSAAQPTAFGALLLAEGVGVASLSPELFVALQREGTAVHAMTRPMKGTAPRGRDLAEDDACAAALAASPKERAENVMIVDLLRNDLGRVCVPGSVRVPSLFAVERYRTVLQMVSTVTGTLASATSLGDTLAALFPCGSVTGAPKRRAMELLRDLEAGPRGVYTGAIGYALPAAGGGMERAVFSVAIRTLTVAGGVGRFGVGGGIVLDSTAEAEYRELETKTRFVTHPSPPLGLFETMRVEEGRVLRLAAHLERLTSSAAYYGIPADGGAARAAIAAALEAAPDGRVLRLRLDLDEEGTFRAVARTHADPTPTACGAAAQEVWPVVLAEAPVDARSPRQRHKTTDRAAYDAASAWAAAAGVADVLFLNAEGRVAEGAISTVFVRKDGILLTPPLDDGALPGILRAELLASGAAREGALRPQDLGGDLLIGNALRGLRPARLVRDRTFIERHAPSDDRHRPGPEGPVDRRPA